MPATSPGTKFNRQGGSKFGRRGHPQVPEDEDRPKLTPREAEILKWSMQGKSTWDIARILGLSEHTVNFHVRNASAKLQTSSRTQTVARAIALGLI